MSRSKPSPIDPSFLEPFLLLAENRFAHAAIQRLTRHPRRNQSTLVYLYGPAGIGKSHLATQLRQTLVTNHPDMKHVSVGAAEFARQLMEAIERKKTSDFQQKYRCVDLFICEDIQALERRTPAQWELLSCLDTLLPAGQPVLLTCQKPPGQLKTFLPRLINRFRAGTCASIKLPSESSRFGLINHFARTRQIPLAPDAARFLAANLHDSPRDLLSTLDRLDLVARKKKCRFDLSFARQQLILKSARSLFSIPQIAKAVARHFGVTLSALRSRSRSQSLTLPRQCAMVLARELTEAQYRQIGYYFGKRSHSTVVYACQRLAAHLPDEPDLRQELSQIRNTLYDTRHPSR